MLFESFYTVPFNLLGQPRTFADLEQVIPVSGKILTLHKLTQLASILDCNLAWDDLLPYQYNPFDNTNTASSLAETIDTLEGPILLGSGKALHEAQPKTLFSGRSLLTLPTTALTFSQRPKSTMIVPYCFS